MDEPKARRHDRPTPRPRPSQTAHAAGRTLHSWRRVAWPILDRFLRPIRLEEFLRDPLPRADRRSRVPTATGLLILVKNLLLSREPLYGIGQWAARPAPEPLGVSPEQLPARNDDRLGRCLDRLFDADIPTLALAVVAHAVRQFDGALEELHNASTTVPFHGDYHDADQEWTLRGQLRRAVTWGHNKDHRPDLKHLLYLLTVTRDGAVPVQFRVQSGHATDDRSHHATWEWLCRLTGRRDFLSVANCKLATAENLAHVHQHGGRFLSVLPRTRGEDAACRATVRAGQVRWRHLHDQFDDEGNLMDRFRVPEPEATSAEGYRLIWYHSERTAELDALARHQRVERTLERRAELQGKLASPRSRYRQPAKGAQAVDALLCEGEVEGRIAVTVGEQTTEAFRQERQGRPGPATRSVRRQRTRFDRTCRVDHARLTQEARCDRLFPLITNGVALSALELLLAYKQQPMIEKRFAQPQR